MKEIRKVLSAIKRRHNNATPGPWGPIRNVVDFNKIQRWPTPVGSQERYIHLYDEEHFVATAHTLTNANFIMHSWNDIKNLLSICEDLLQRLEID